MIGGQQSYGVLEIKFVRKVISVLSGLVPIGIGDEDSRLAWTPQFSGRHDPRSSKPALR